MYNFKRPESEGRVEIKSLDITGISKSIVKHIKSNIDEKNKKMTFNFYLRIPEIHTEGTYKANIRINTQTLTPRGYLNLTASEFLNHLKLS